MIVQEVFKRKVVVSLRGDRCVVYIGVCHDNILLTIELGVQALSLIAELIQELSLFLERFLPLVKLS